ncbi:MAG: S9 family peptidase [Planctomycetota bacterium]|nr:MAG: S9 family peptidase [Planctomycetota bacterium]
MHRVNSLPTLLVFFLLAPLNSASAAQGSRADYERADALRELARDKVLDAAIDAHWLPDADSFWYVRRGREGKQFLLVDAQQGAREPAFDHELLAAGLTTALAASGATETTFDARNLPFRELEFVAEGRGIQFELEGYEWTCQLADYTCARGDKLEPRDERSGRAERRKQRREARRRRLEGPWTAPDETFEVLVRDHDIHLRSLIDAREFRLSHDGTEERPYGAATWSPDSQHIVAYRITPGDVEDVYTIETSPTDQLAAKLHSQSYARPGDRLPAYELHVYSVATKEGLRADVEPIDFQGPPRLHWRADGNSFTYEKRDRGHQRARVLAVDVATGAAGTLIDERADTFIDQYHKHTLMYVSDGAELLWASERDGWNHLYLYDGVAGGLVNQVTAGPWLVRGVDHVDSEARRIWFSASGMNPGEDPYHLHHYRIDFDGTNLVTLTEGDGTHQLQWSRSRAYFVDTWSRVDAPPKSVLRDADGALVMELSEANIDDLLAAGLRLPEVFHAKGRDGETDIWGVIHRPTNFDESRQYPVIEQIYAGPHDSHVPKSFRALHSAQAIAELGFVVVQIDGMGTNNRSKAFLDVCWHNLADAGFPDRIAWIRAAAERYPYMDLERVGIHGVSAGGQNALGALLFHPEFYKVAVSACGCHDNRLDKASWNEQWMGYPVGPHYAEQSNVTHAKNLEGELLLILGELDTNVPPESTYRVIDELIRADKDFDFILLPGAGHGGGGAYGERRRRDFFVRHLLGREPRWEP